MPSLPRLSKLELQIMEALWSAPGPRAIRELQESFPEKQRPAYTTIQTTVYRLEAKGAVRRTRKISNAHLYEALVTRDAARGRLIDEFLAFFGGRPQPVMAHLVETGRLTLDDVRQAEKLIRAQQKKDAPK